MLSVATRSFRIRAAIALAALYALCILAPSAAFALSGNASAAHCLIEDHATADVHAAMAHGQMHHDGMHMHADGTSHAHAKASQTEPTKPNAPAHKSSSGDCCGLLSVSALPAAAFEVQAPALPAMIIVATNREAVTGKSPDRLYRPPIS
jgi:hypothetical protein